MSWEATSLRFRILAALAIAAAMAALLELRPSVRLAARQRALLEWAQSGGPRAFVEEFAAPDYRDQWGHDAEAVVAGMQRVRFAWPGMSLEAGGAAVESEGAAAVIRQSLVVHGVDDVRRGDFVFRWRRQDWKPWSWRLVSVEAPGIDW